NRVARSTRPSGPRRALQRQKCVALPRNLDSPDTSPNEAFSAPFSTPEELAAAVILSGDFVSSIVYCNWLCFQYVLSFATREKAFFGPLFSRCSQLRYKCPCMNIKSP